MTETILVRTAWAETHPLLTEYYDSEWGDVVNDEAGVFERLCLETFQSGLSWLTILKKRDALRSAFRGFDPDAVTSMGSDDVDHLLEDPRIIRNRRKIEAVLTNARATVALRDPDEGSDLASLVWSYMPETSPAESDTSKLPSSTVESRALARELKERGFTMVGPTTVFAMMCAIGVVDLHIVDSHRRGCSGLWNRDGTRAS